MTQREFTQSILQSITDGIVLLDGRYEVLYANARYLEMWGFEGGSAFRMSGSELFEYQINMLEHPEGDAFALRLVHPSTVSAEPRCFKMKDGRWLERISCELALPTQRMGVLLQWRDVTSRQLETIATQYERDLMHSMMDSVPDQIFFKDRDSRFLRINSSLAKRFGLSQPGLAIGKSDADFYSAEHAARTFEEEREIMRSGVPIYNQLHREVWSDGREAWNVSMKLPLRNSSGQIVGTYGIAHDITEQKKTETLIWRQANFDTLTGIPNRRMLRDRWEQSFAGHRRNGHQLGLMMLDLDRFKEINDSLGHAAGDQLLVQASRRLETCLRATDTLARMGGDEFAIILTNLVPESNVGDIAHKIISCFDEAFVLEGQKIFVSVSIGIALSPQDGEDFDELLKLADQALYEAKAKGRNGFCFFTSSLQERASKRLRMGNDLRVALEQQQFHLVYQPIVNLKTGGINKAEALIRWNHPEQGLIPPVEFIPIAESLGLIMDIGDWVFRTAVKQVQEWRAKNHLEIQVAVNKSPQQLQTKGAQTADWIAHLRDSSLPCNAIVMEVTEGVLLDATGWVKQQLSSMRDAGMRISLDDFGTGYSSLSYLHQYDIDFLKIDQSFVRNLESVSKNFALCKAIVEMAHALGIQVIAEGIETQSQRDLLLQIGCDYGQGYFFAKPMLPEAFMRLV